MRPVPILSQPNPNASDAEKIRWLMDMMKQICDSSQQESNAIADPFTITNGVTTRTLNVSTATATDVAKVLGTLIADMKRRGMNRAAG